MKSVKPQSMPEEEEEEEDDRQARKRSRVEKEFMPERSWVKGQDIQHPPQEEYQHPMPQEVLQPYQYFQKFFTLELLDMIVYQTNLYARQRNVTTGFSIDANEMLVFIGCLIYMGIVTCPSIEDYWSYGTRVPQVAGALSSKRFRLIRSMVHFNDNDHANASTDRFYKIRPVMSKLTKQFRKVRETPTQSVDEVMVSYKGTRAGNLRQYIQSKPDKWGYKLFCRASIDGFIHDILMYQGETTFSSHDVPLIEEESKFLVSSKTVIVLAKTLKSPKKTTICADNYFSSMGLVTYLRDTYGIRYVGTARVNRVDRPPLMAPKDMENKSVPRGTYEFCASDGIVAVRWKDNKPVTIISSDVGVMPLGTVDRYDREKKKMVPIQCPRVINEYNDKMGGIDKSDMLTHLYKTPMRARRWYIRLFGYAIDLAICNAWILYKRDFNAWSAGTSEKVMPLKNFRLVISDFARCQKGLIPRRLRSADHVVDAATVVVPSSQDIASNLLRRGQKTIPPPDNLRYDNSKYHCPIYVKTRQTCKLCSKNNDIHRTKWMCRVCKVALCLSDTRNCFWPYHQPPATAVTSDSPAASQSPSRPSTLSPSPSSSGAPTPSPSSSRAPTPSPSTAPSRSKTPSPRSSKM